jgi:hypothetical protein
MTHTVLQRCFGAVALFGALALVGACSGTGSTLLSPTGTSAGSLRASTGNSAFNPFPNEDPCAAAPASASFDTNPNEPPPPPPECDGTGRFTGGGFQINANDVKVTRGFTLHCDVLLSNNFEVNWAGGNNFHIDKLGQTATCQFISDPNPPDAPVNRIRLTGTGTLNGQPATVILILIDNGEKTGAPPDQAYIQINAEVLAGLPGEIPTNIDGGNIQAHEDQPHK